MNTEEELYDPTIQTGAESEGGIVDLILGYLRYWKWFLLSLFVFSVIGYFYVKTQVPQYSIQTQILLKDAKQATNKMVLEELGVTPPNLEVENEILIIKSSSLIEKVVKDLALQTEYYAEGRLNKRLLYLNEPAKVEMITPSRNTYTKPWPIQVINNNEVLFNGQKVPFNKPTSTAAGVILVKPVQAYTKEPYFVSFSSVEDVARVYLSRLMVAPVSKQSNMLVLSTEDAIPKRGEDFLNAVVQAYIEASLSDKTQTIANTIAWIDERIKVLQRELGTEERNVQQFKSQNNTVDLGTQASQIYGRVTANDAKVTDINLQLTMLKQIEGFLAKPDNVDVVQPSMLGLSDGTITSMVSQLGTLKLQKQSLLRTIPETNPVVASINDQILSLKRSLKETLGTLRSNLLLSKREVEKLNSKFESDLQQVPVRERELVDVMRNQSIKNNLFNFLLQKREETGLALAQNTADGRVINPARATGAPIKPVKSTLYMIFVCLGIGLPLGVILLKDMLNNTVRRKSDITRTTRAPIIAQISHSDDANALTITAKPRSVIAEQVRALRTNLDFLIANPDSKTILFTSTVSGEGKSFISLNLGASLASTGKKVIILELDLRKPKLLSTLGMEKKVGLSDYLIGKVAYKDIIREVPQQENFYMIESGTIPPNPAEILMNRNMPVMIAELKRDYDYILIDAPPIGLVTDAQILGQYADVTFFLIRHNFTRKAHITLLNELYVKRVFRNLNIIFNSIDASSFGYGYQYDYSYYGEAEPKKGFWAKLIGKS
ncbi:polysaccharide biosynthesis tyrosine autokinase [Mucilaginibacter sp. PAMB04168]|uniref:GumC family protein n=1 Tax=Mucilaginibacter sp. PAMB04168 TaxID=3138567 RepID=UPI0031F6F0B3